MENDWMIAIVADKAAHTIMANFRPNLQKSHELIKLKSWVKCKYFKNI